MSIDHEWHALQDDNLQIYEGSTFCRAFFVVSLSPNKRNAAYPII